CMQNLEYPWTF
nr:immunoglobulin light chain junction region [Macaca mulatta]MOV75166.1 immunoglobulin light chain junction region [Macaca mulatta]MOV75200.1 immunoglobulin light chain junction region [Macaca mulatta]MOV75799.1 immunoglobulin light chain junction region [Macaca mulatta]MOV75850.1 immunoglobulin light chain junction region [Macaca mulatta]